MLASHKAGLFALFKKVLMGVASFILLLSAVAFYLDLHLYLRPIPPDFDQAIEQEIEAAKFPSMSVLVFKKDKVVFSKQYGLANVEQNRAATDDTLYQIASVSKLVTATAVLQLYEQGHFDLDDDINPYLPFKVINPHFPDAKITFRMLLAHTSSINDGPAFWDSYTIGESEDPTLSLNAFLTDYFTPANPFYDADKNFIQDKPGTRLNYSNMAFGLLGYLVEHISGQPFNEYCKEAIFDPLQMPSTAWLNKEINKQKAAMPYGYNIFSKRYEPIGYYSFNNYPDGALKTSTSEFMRFLHLFISQGQTINGEQFLKPQTINEMLRAQYPDVSSIPALSWAIDGPHHMHGGSDPGVSTMVMISKEEQWGVIIFANSGGLQAWRTELGLEIRDSLYDYIKQYGVDF